MYCLIIVLFSNISNIPPILHKSKSFPCLARAMPAFRMCKFCMCKFCRLGHCMGLMFQMGLSWGCVLQKQLGRDRPLLPPPEIPRLGFPINLQENRHYCLRNIFKRSVGRLERSRIAFASPGSGYSLKGINRVKTQNSGIYALADF